MGEIGIVVTVANLIGQLGTGSALCDAVAWARVQYWHLLTAKTTAAIIPRSAGVKPDLLRITNPMWSAWVCMMQGRMLETA